MLEVDTGVDHRDVDVDSEVVGPVDVDVGVVVGEDPLDAGRHTLDIYRNRIVGLDVSDPWIVCQRSCCLRRQADREALDGVLIDVSEGAVVGPGRPCATSGTSWVALSSTTMYDCCPAGNAAPALIIPASKPTTASAVRHGLNLK